MDCHMLEPLMKARGMCFSERLLPGKFMERSVRRKNGRGIDDAESVLRAIGNLCSKK
jgi:hypothetical protein